MNVALVGAGRVGTAVASFLRAAGHSIVVVAPEDRASSELAADLLGAPVGSLSGAGSEADLILVGVPDAAIEPVARSLAPSLVPGATVAHFAGALGLDPLGPASSAGARRAAIHPVQACPDVATAIARLPGSYWGITCDADAADGIRSMVEGDLSGRPVMLEEEVRPVWHAATVTTGNGISALLALAESMLAAIDVGAPAEVLGPLAAGVVANAREGGGGAATLTGPVVRAETATIHRHIDALARMAPDLLPGYKRAATVIIDAAYHGRRIDEVVSARLRDVLEDT